MDSISQLALGSAVTMAAMGRRTAAWKAAVWGALAGTLPDLDVVIDHGDAILNMVRHRAESHSLLYLTLLSLPFAWLVNKIHGHPEHARAWWLALWLALCTHPLLDWMTVYGTQLLQPFTDYPFAIGSIFIIDPLYTLPLLAGVIVALASSSRDRHRAALWSLVISSGYLAWSVAAQQHVRSIVLASLQDQGIAAQEVLVTPAPFNTLLWRAVAVTPTHYYEGFYALADGKRPLRWSTHDRGAALIAAYKNHPHVQRIAWFSHGFFRMREVQGHISITDLRMGQEPAYSFDFDLGPATELRPGSPVEQKPFQRAEIRRALPWLWQRLQGQDVPRPAASHSQDGTLRAATG